MPAGNLRLAGDGQIGERCGYPHNVPDPERRVGGDLWGCPAPWVGLRFQDAAQAAFAHIERRSVSR
jgi:hypothetical protein